MGCENVENNAGTQGPYNRALRSKKEEQGRKVIELTRTAGATESIGDG